MKIVLYSINFYPELTGIGKYNGEMAHWFAANGHQISVVTAPPYYPGWKIAKPYTNNFWEESLSGVNVIRCPLFVPEKVTTLTRIIHLLSFSLSSIWGLFKLRNYKPDILLLVEPTLFCAPAALIYSFLTRSKIVLMVQDYEIDAMLGLGLYQSGYLSSVARKIETFLMKRFDRVSSISKSMLRLAVKKGCLEKDLIFFPNWVDTEFISPLVDKSHFRNLWNIPDNKKIIMYSGNMGKKQGLEIVLEAAAKLSYRDDLIFLMVGDGAAKDGLIELAKKMNILNIIFKPLQEYIYLPYLLATPDIHLVIQKRGAADVVLPSKLSGILSVGGHSIITAEPETELGLLIKDFPGIANLIEPESVDALVESILSFDGVDTKSFNQIARNYSESFLNANSILLKFSSELEFLSAK